jgi:hypothetical protein
MTLLLVALLPVAIGFCLVRVFDSGNKRVCRHDLFRVVLGTGIGIGVCSECYFAGLVSRSSDLRLEIFLLLATGLGLAFGRQRARCRFCETPHESKRDTALAGWLGAALGLMLIVDSGVFAWIISVAPMGGWDAWAIWNLRAHFLYRAGGAAWRDGFTEVLAWSHPDYPLLLPGFVARGWNLLNGEESGVPVGLAAFFTFGPVALITASMAILRGASQGFLAGIALAATPFLVVQGAKQCADVPLAFFILATLAAMTLAERFHSRGLAVLAGAAAALAGWAKNEGLLWLSAFIIAQAIVTRWRFLPAFLAGSLPVMLPILFFKARVATSSDIFGAAGRAGMLTRALDPTRYSLIATEGLKHVWSFGPLLIGAFVMLAAYLAVSGTQRGNEDRASLYSGALALTFAATGYFAIYVLGPFDLQWLLDTSSDRLLLQIWPGIVFVVFLAARAPHRESSPLTRAGELAHPLRVHE